jgi:hypothetical protein
MARNKSAVELERTEVLLPKPLKVNILASLEGMGIRTLTDFVVSACEKTLKTAKKKNFTVS